MTEAATTPITGVRPEIQGLRALAVAAVVVYHLWPHRLSGGFAGVDVFFAISGFLITAHLLREVGTTGGLNVGRFWARRIRRLLPASLLVLAVSAVGVLVWVSPTYWEQMFTEIGASAIYGENWQLALSSVDYLAQTNIASPVQHFWSLSVEEQFYIVWPLMIVLSLVAARRFTTRNRRLVIGVVLAVITLGSFIWSLHETRSLPASAYFETTTRAWEFGAGAMLAFVAPATATGFAVVRTAVSGFGWAAIGFSLVAFTGATAFPGRAAAVPVIGALAVIWAGSDGLRWTPTYVFRLRPVQFLGDISYSLYLWHWPLIVLVPLALGTELNDLERIGILVVSIALAWASRVWVEDPVRSGYLARARTWRTFAAAALCMAVLLAGAGVGLNGLAIKADTERATAQGLIDADTPCLGAAAIAPENQPCSNPKLAGVMLPTLTSSFRDISSTWHDCQSPSPTAEECILGTRGGTRVALVGDSHAHQWVSALQRIALKHRWELHLIVHGSCPFSHVPWKSTGGNPYADCTVWNARVDRKLATEAPYKLVITSMRAQGKQSVFGDVPIASATLAGFRASWQPLIDRGTVIVALRDSPNVGNGPRKCMVANPGRALTCDRSRAFGLASEDYLADAASETPGAVLVDMTDYFCTLARCPAVIGGILVERDDQHISDTYAKTLAPYLDSRITAAVAQAHPPAAD